MLFDMNQLRIFFKRSKDLFWMNTFCSKWPTFSIFIMDFSMVDVWITYGPLLRAMTSGAAVSFGASCWTLQSGTPNWKDERSEGHSRWFHQTLVWYGYIYICIQGCIQYIFRVSGEFCFVFCMKLEVIRESWRHDTLMERFTSFELTSFVDPEE